VKQELRCTVKRLDVDRTLNALYYGIEDCNFDWGKFANGRGCSKADFLQEQLDRCELQLFQPLQGGKCLAIANESGGNSGQPAPFALKDTCLEALIRIMQKDSPFRALFKGKAVRVRILEKSSPVSASSYDAASALLELSCSGAKLNRSKMGNASESEILAEQTTADQEDQESFPDHLVEAAGPLLHYEEQILSRKKASARPGETRETEKLRDLSDAGATDSRECRGDMELEFAPAKRRRKREQTSFYDPAVPDPCRVTQKEMPSVYSREFEIGDQVSCWHS